MSKYLLAPLNWGLGHASRCIPLIHRFLDEGHEVVLGGDGDSLTLLRKHFPKLRYVYLAPLNLQYSSSKSQVWAMIKAIPQLIAWSIKDHITLKAVLREEHFDQIISDNRFGLYLSNSEAVRQQSGPTGEAGQTHCVYVTHQLHIMLPRGWRWLEPLAERLHGRIYRRFDEVWIPDYEQKDKSLAGDLSHLSSPLHPFTSSSFHLSPFTFKYLGPLSRFEMSKYRNLEMSNNYDIVAVLSGLEPHRTLLEQDIIARYAGSNDQVLIVQGLVAKPKTTIKRSNITIVPYLNDDELAQALLNSKHIIARSGYSTIMDLEALGLLKRNEKENNFQFSILNPPFPIFHFQLELIPTPGQPEQEYLAHWLHSRLP